MWHEIQWQLRAGYTAARENWPVNTYVEFDRDTSVWEIFSDVHPEGVPYQPTYEDAMAGDWSDMQIGEA
jgi:hypothetical protein